MAIHRLGRGEQPQLHARGQPVDTGLHGHPCRLRLFRRLERHMALQHLEKLRAPDNNYSIDDYWQGWLEPAGGPVSPLVVQFLHLPEGMPVGMKVHEPVDVTGYFFKRYAYNAADTIRVAPLLMALEPAWKPLPPVTPGGTSLGTWAIVTMSALVAATLLGMAISGLSLAQISRAIWPQIIVMLIVLFLTTYIPEFALALQPRGR
jgi:hypothetical protein